MIGYLVKSTVCLTIILLVYLLALEREKMHRFNRVYLLLGLMLSLIIPFLPSGEVIYETYTTSPIVQLILLNEEILPHTFLHNIYVNQDQYHNGEIDEKLFAHEYAHASQRHSWDVLFIELLKAIFWFNPLLILYKRVIQLNHEFLADEAVIQQYKEVSTYQHLLVDACQNNNQIYLASNINFLLTKKRLKMMTKKSSRKRIYMLMAGVIPVAIALVMMLGQPVVAQSETQDVDRPEILEDGSWNEISKKMLNEDTVMLKDSYFKNAIVRYEKYDGRLMETKYNELPESIKSKLPVPSLSQFGDSAVIQVLEKGTIVHLKPDGSVAIEDETNRFVKKITSQDRPSKRNELKEYKFMRGIGLKVPYSFSPNGDGRNESLKIRTRGLTGIKNYRLTIFNKFGEMMFESEDLEEGWNGKVKNIEGEPEGGIYIYSLSYEDADGLEYKRNGEVKLIMDPNQMIPVVEDGKLSKKKISDIDTVPTPPNPPKPPKVSDIIPPPPPGAPKVKKGNDLVPPPPPSTTSDLDAGIPPIPPNAPMTFEGLEGRDVTFWLDGKEISEDQMKAINSETIEKIDVIKGEGQSDMIIVYSKSERDDKLIFIQEKLDFQTIDDTTRMKSVIDKDVEYILDGKVVDVSVVEQLNQDDIKVVSVLKKTGPKKQIIITSKRN